MRVGSVAWVMAAFLAGWLSGLSTLAEGQGEEGEPNIETFRALGKFAQVVGYIQRSYVEDVSVDAMVEASLNGLLKLLDGPSQYLDAESVKAIEEEARLRFGGVGLVLTGAAPATVAEVLADGPADRAGVKEGWHIRRVDGVDTSSLAAAGVAQRISGPVGKIVHLEVSDGSKITHLQLVRASIRPSTVASKRFGSVGYVRIFRFDASTAEELRQAMPPTERIVMDLRGNPGGLVGQAVAVAGLWLDGGPVILIEEKGLRPRVEIASRGRWAPSRSMVILIDHNTASAAEIVAGSLRDRGRCLLFGRRSYGKGSVQSMFGLEDGSALKLTTARYRLPSGKQIDGFGLTPDRTVEYDSRTLVLGQPAEDPVLAEAIRFLSGDEDRAR